MDGRDGNYKEVEVERRANRKDNERDRGRRNPDDNPRRIKILQAWKLNFAGEEKEMHEEFLEQLDEYRKYNEVSGKEILNALPCWFIHGRTLEVQSEINLLGSDCSKIYGTSCRQELRAEVRNNPIIQINKDQGENTCARCAKSVAQSMITAQAANQRRCTEDLGKRGSWCAEWSTAPCAASIGAQLIEDMIEEDNRLIKEVMPFFDVESGEFYKEEECIQIERISGVKEEKIPGQTIAEKQKRKRLEKITVGQKKSEEPRTEQQAKEREQQVAARILTIDKEKESHIIPLAKKTRSRTEAT